MSTRTSVAAAGVGLAVLGTTGALLGAPPAFGASMDPLGRQPIQISVSWAGGTSELATDRAYQTFRSGERAAFGRVAASPIESFRSGERADYGVTK